MTEWSVESLYEHVGGEEERSLGRAELGHRLPGCPSSRDDVALRRNNYLCVAVASVLNGREQCRKDCSYGLWICRSNVVESCNGGFVEFDLRITWNDLKWTKVIAAVKMSKAVSPTVRL